MEKALSLTVSQLLTYLAGCDEDAHIYLDSYYPVTHVRVTYPALILTSQPQHEKVTVKHLRDKLNNAPGDMKMLFGHSPTSIVFACNCPLGVYLSRRSPIGMCQTTDGFVFPPIGDHEAAGYSVDLGDHIPAPLLMVLDLEFAPHNTLSTIKAAAGTP